MKSRNPIAPVLIPALLTAPRRAAPHRAAPRRAAPLAAALLLAAACDSSSPLPGGADMATAPPDLALTPPDLAVAPPDLAACKPATTPGASVLVPCATRIELVDEGNGFRPPPPMGSNCHGESTFRLALESRTLDWKVCRIPSDLNTPWLLASGTRTLTATELDGALPALRAVALVDGMRPCGADKPMRTMIVSTPAGTETYIDSFYICQMRGLYVDRIDGAFSALAALAK